MLLKKVAVVPALILTFISSLQVLPQAQAYSSPEPLPAGVRALAYVYGFGSGVDSRLNSEGRLEFLSEPLNRSVTLEEMAESEPDLLRLKDFLSELDPVWAENLLAANLYSGLSVNESRKVSGFLWGLTDRLALGVIMPWIERDMAFSFEAAVTNNAATIAKSVGNNAKLQDGLRQLAEYPLNTQSFVKSVFLDRGYTSPMSAQYKGWGDAEIETRYTYYVGRRWGLGLRGGVVAPTSTHDVDIRNPLDQDIAENTWAYRLTHLSEFQIVPKRLYWSMSFGGKYRSAKKQTRAYALNSDAILPDLNDPWQIETVSKKIGSEFNFDTGLQASFFGGLINVMGSYFYSAKASDSIAGSRGLDYQRETSGTASQLQGYEAAIEISTFTAFQRNAFFIPMKLTAAYVHPISGRNTIFAPYWRFDSVILF